MRLSISAKIFVGFLVVLGTFGGVATYDAVIMRRLGDELRLVSRSFELRLEVSELQTGLNVLIEQVGKPDAQRMPWFVKPALDQARRHRLKQQMPQALADLHSLELLRVSPEDHTLLDHVRAGLERVEDKFRADEELSTRPMGTSAMRRGRRAAPRSINRAAPSKSCSRPRRGFRTDLRGLVSELRLLALKAETRLEESEGRAVWPPPARGHRDGRRARGDGDGHTHPAAAPAAGRPRQGDCARRLQAAGGRFVG